jgi:hypothetical protein
MCGKRSTGRLKTTGQVVQGTSAKCRQPPGLLKMNRAPVTAGHIRFGLKTNHDVGKCRVCLASLERLGGLATTQSQKGTQSPTTLS